MFYFMFITEERKEKKRKAATQGNITQHWHRQPLEKKMIRETDELTDKVSTPCRGGWSLAAVANKRRLGGMSVVSDIMCIMKYSMMGGRWTAQ